MVEGRAGSARVLGRRGRLGCLSNFPKCGRVGGGCEIRLMSHGRKPTRNLDAMRVTYASPGEHKKKIKDRATNVPLSCEYDHIPYVPEKWGGSKANEEPPQP